LRGFFGIESVMINSRKLFEIYYTKTCLKTIEKNLYGNNNYKLLKNLIVNDIENNCQDYDFTISNLENLKFN